MFHRSDKKTYYSGIVIGISILCMMGEVVYGATGTIDPGNKYGWGENMGWINFAPTDSQNVYHGLVISDTAITGYAWSSMFGWINFSPSNGGVTNTCSTGQLGGYAWSESFGWIPMSGVFISENGVFTGVGGTTNSAGRINFSCTHCSVKTDWRRCGGSDIPPTEPPPSEPPTEPPAEEPPILPPIEEPPVETPPTEPPPSEPPTEPPAEEPPILPPIEEPPVETPPTEPPTTPPTGGGTESGGSGMNTVTTIVNTQVQKTLGIVTELGKSALNIISNSLEKTSAGRAVKETVTVVYETTREVIDNPVVEKTNKIVVTPVIATAAVGQVVATGFGLSQALLYIRLIFSQPFLFYRRRKQKQWGVVYNAYTKQPIDLAAIRLINAETGTISRTQVTDTDGRYFISGDKGTYRIEVQKEGFAGESVYLKKLSEDRAYSNLYHGEKFIIDDETKDLNYNIPLDPALEEKTSAHIIGEYTRVILQKSVSVIGIVATVISLVISPRLFVGALLLIHIIVYVIIDRISLQRVKGAAGLVTEAGTSKPVGKAVVRVFDSAYHKLVAMAVTDRKGRYAVLVGPSTYYITIEKKGYVQYESNVLDFSSEKTNGKGGLITENVILKTEDGSV